jgi:hypothetical protein
MYRTVAVDEPMGAGAEFDYLGRPFRVLYALTKDEYLSSLRSRRALQSAAGMAPARSGIYNSHTRQFTPGQDVPGSCRYFYVVMPADESNRR